MSELVYLIFGTASMVLMMIAIIIFVYIYQRKLKKRSMAYHEIEKLMQKQELDSAYAIIEGQEQERKRIASDLHDNVGGLLATLKIYSDLIIANTEPAEISRLNIKVNAIAEDLAVEIRELSHALGLSTLAGFGLKVAIEHLCEALVATNKLKVAYFIDNLKPIKEDTSLNIYRVIQELFTNTLKHAEASEVRLEISVIGDELTMIYEDNGKGFNTGTATAGMGMRSIRSRVEHIAGRLTIDSTANGTAFIIETNDI